MYIYIYVHTYIYYNICFERCIFFLHLYMQIPVLDAPVLGGHLGPVTCLLLCVGSHEDCAQLGGRKRSIPESPISKGRWEALGNWKLIKDPHYHDVMHFIEGVELGNLQLLQDLRQHVVQWLHRYYCTRLSPKKHVFCGLHDFMCGHFMQILVTRSNAGI